MVRLAAGLEHERVYGVTISDPGGNVTVVLCSDSPIFQWSFYSRDLHEEETIVFEAHGVSFPCTELLLFNYAKVNTIFHSMAALIHSDLWIWM